MINNIPKLDLKHTKKHIGYSLLLALPSALYNLFVTFAQFFYTDILKLPATSVGRGWFLFGFWNSLNDPIAGIVSDKFRDKFGNRNKLVKAIIFPLIITYALIWWPKTTDNTNLYLLYFIIVISLFDLFNSLFTLNMNSIIPGTFKTLKERTGLITLVNVVLLIVMGITISAAPTIFTNYGWRTFGLVFSLPVLLILYKATAVLEVTKEEINENNLLVLANIKDLFKRKYFWNIAGLWFFSRVLLALAMSVLPFYAKYTLLIEEAKIGYLMGAMLLGSMCSLLVWKKLIVMYGTKKTLSFAILCSLAISLLVLPVTSIQITILIFVLIGFFSSGTQITPIIMGTEIIDKDIKESGKKREGLLYGLLGSAIRFPPAITGLVLGELLARVAYNPSIAPLDNPSEVGLAIKYYFFTGSVIALLITYIFNYYYNEPQVPAN